VAGLAAEEDQQQTVPVLRLAVSLVFFLVTALAAAAGAAIQVLAVMAALQMAAINLALLGQAVQAQVAVNLMAQRRVQVAAA
jgi:hypothetical protein